MLKFSVQTFYQPLFSIFPLAILFPSKRFPHQKAQSKAPKAKSRKQMPLFLLQGSFIAANRVEQGRGVTLQQENPVFLLL
jgi:hypothetical protein